MKWYAWETDIGQAIACAESPEAARAQILATLCEGDVAIEELRAAIRGRPEIVGDSPFAIMAWHH
jgi:hypothetical protein